MEFDSQYLKDLSSYFKSENGRGGGRLARQHEKITMIQRARVLLSCRRAAGAAATATAAADTAAAAATAAAATAAAAAAAAAALLL